MVVQLYGSRLISSLQPPRSMSFLLRIRCVTAIEILVALGLPMAAANPVLPHLRQQGSATQLIVDGQPYLIRGGELSNSHGEPDFLRASWPKLKALNLNTIIAPVYWDVVEPVANAFAWATVDGLLADARANGMRLVLLWFGSWKNSMSCYVPAWVKTDPVRFPRARSSNGQPLEVNLGGVTFSVTYEHLESPGLADGVINEAGDRPANRTQLLAGAIVIQLGPDEFLFGGLGVAVTFAPPPPGDPWLGILECEEGRYHDGPRWFDWSAPAMIDRREFSMETPHPALLFL